MKHYFKKMMALVIAAVMVMAMTTIAWATDTTVPANAEQDWKGDTHHDTTWRGTADGTVSVQGLEVGDTVKFYKVLGYNPDANKTIANAVELTSGSGNWGAAGWELLAPFDGTGSNPVTIAEFKKILTEGISADLAGKIGKSAIGTANYTATAADVDGTVVASAEVDPGLYVAIVTPANTGVMYNPIFVANDYYKTGTGDVSSTWTPVETPLSYSDSAMAKKAPITVTKVATEDSEAANETDDAKAVGKGDKINFTVTTTIPEFADNYTAPIFIITDTMTSGLTLDTSSVKVYSATVNNGTYTKGSELAATEGATIRYTYPEGTTTAAGYKIVFNSHYLLSLDQATPIWIEYSATVTETATENVNEEDNTVNVEYSHEPSVDAEGEGKKVGDKTHHYTFTIDGNVLGDSQTKTTEVVKVGLDKDGKEIEQTTTIVNGKKIGALQGAEFKLYTDASCTTEYNKGDYAATTATASGNKIVSDEEGRLTLNGKTTGISGLDAGTYYLKEMKAPDGYIRQQDATKIQIIPTFYGEVTWTKDDIEYKSDDILKSYAVLINDIQTAEYTLNYEMEGELPKNDVCTSDTDNMKTNLGNVIISKNGPVITTSNVTTNTEGKILNTQGTELPSTGGIGTTIFYVIGAILVIGAGIVLITRRRMSVQ